MIFLGKGNKKKFASTKAIPSGISRLSMKTLRTNFVTHTMINCLQPNYMPLNPEKYGWQKLDNMWVPLRFKAPPLPSLHELDELDDAHENVDTNDGESDLD